MGSRPITSVNKVQPILNVVPIQTIRKEIASRREVTLVASQSLPQKPPATEQGMQLRKRIRQRST